MATDMRCKNCKHWDKSDTSIFGGWCLLGCHLHEDKNVSSGVDAEDHCFDWEAKDGKEAEV